MSADEGKANMALWAGGGCALAIFLAPLALILCALVAAGAVFGSIFGGGILGSVLGGIFGGLFGGSGGGGGGVNKSANFSLNGGGAPLNTTEVPTQHVPWVLKAGSTCALVGPAVIAAQIEQESGWNPKAVSPVGAQGISQFMPGTWQTWGRDDDGNGRASPFDPGDAIMAQARYDCALADQVGGYLASGKATGRPLDLTLAAYNAGPGAILEAGGMPSYPETTGYVARIHSLIAKYEAVDQGHGEVPKGKKMAIPLPGHPQVTSPFGNRVHPVTGKLKLHTGTDFGAVEGSSVLAAREGTVVSAGWNDAYGNRVVIDHGTIDGRHIETTYNHMSALKVRQGERVSAGTVVGAVGTTGLSTGPHLHFEVRADGQYVDPAPWLGVE
ncbi:peptidoglycan DD-metalloendopeptidase family protein [Wenjunlia tyrosinilytica]|uniref:Peptidase n=1 Tax=Wenjunlia tyrosinilytica TaxID=1544741 RepID=A0A917ZVT7_9ACTN|nr:peptidoglycan DD-metalloendopeptidase family protein [Wenjunlia tyrosinilytica]GGO95745.1 peptidase [Wenjunlia tyrosinilytica]